MNILYSQLSTLFSLWNSLDVDTCTINKKLEVCLVVVHNIFYFNSVFLSLLCRHSIYTNSTPFSFSLQTVIQELEKLICNERKEKSLLTANIEDVMVTNNFA